MAKTNIDYLRELLTTDEQKEFLDAIKKDHQSELESASDAHDLEILNKDEEISGLISQVENMERMSDSIDTGIGTIYFRVEGSIDQQELMEALADVIAREGVRGLMNHLRDVYAV